MENKDWGNAAQSTGTSSLIVNALIQSAYGTPNAQPTQNALSEHLSFHFSADIQSPTSEPIEREFMGSFAQHFAYCVDLYLTLLSSKNVDSQLSAPGLFCSELFKHKDSHAAFAPDSWNLFHLEQHTSLAKAAPDSLISLFPKLEIEGITHVRIHTKVHFSTRLG